MVTCIIEASIVFSEIFFSEKKGGGNFWCSRLDANNPSFAAFLKACAHVPKIKKIIKKGETQKRFKNKKKRTDQNQKRTVGSTNRETWCESGIHSCSHPVRGHTGQHFARLHHTHTRFKARDWIFLWLTFALFLH